MAALMSTSSVVVARPSLRASRASRVATGGRRATVAVRAAARETEAAKAAVVGALVATLAGAPMMEAAPAYAVTATPAQIAAAEKEGAARLASCTTAECRQVIEALNAKKLAKLKGENAPSVAAPKKVVKSVAAPPAPAPAPKAPAYTPPAPAASSNSAASAAAAQKAAAAKAAKAAADKKAADAKKAAAKKAEEERKRRARSSGTNPLFYTIGFVGKFAFAAGALAAPFIYLKKEEVIVDEAGAIDTEKAIKTITGVADTVPNREIVAAYGAAALVALGIVDGIINLPLLNIFIGAPVQILGFVSGLALAVRYLNEGKSPVEDAKKLAVDLNALIPDSLPKPLTDETVRSWK